MRCRSGKGRLGTAVGIQRKKEKECARTVKIAIAWDLFVFWPATSDTIPKMMDRMVKIIVVARRRVVLGKAKRLVRYDDMVGLRMRRVSQA